MIAAAMGSGKKLRDYILDDDPHREERLAKEAAENLEAQLDAFIASKAGEQDGNNR